MTTVRNFPLITGSQNGYVQYNTVIRELAALSFSWVLGTRNNPLTNATHSLYIVGSTPNTEFSGFTPNSLAYRTTDNTWVQYLPNTGLTLYNAELSSFVVYNGTSWIPVTGKQTTTVSGSGGSLTFNNAYANSDIGIYNLPTSSTFTITVQPDSLVGLPVNSEIVLVTNGTTINLVMGTPNTVNAVFRGNTTITTASSPSTTKVRLIKASLDDINYVVSIR